MKFYTFLFLISFTSSLTAQHIISGIIVDTLNQPIEYVNLAQKGSDYIKTSDGQGGFSLVINPRYANVVYFEHHSYKLYKLEGIDTITVPQIIMLHPKESPAPTYIRSGRKKEVSSSVAIDIIDADFDQFTDEIGIDNVDALNGFVGTFNFELGFLKKRRYLGFNWGLIFSESHSNDSLDIEIFKNHFGINLGYRILNSRHVQFLPMTSLKWYRYRLINNDAEDKIPLSQYIENRNLDLRFHQVTGFLGARLEFKLKSRKQVNYNKNFWWTVGIYGGYLFRIHQKARVNSQRNRLSTDKEIDFANYNIGIFVSSNFLN